MQIQYRGCTDACLDVYSVQSREIFLNQSKYWRIKKGCGTACARGIQSDPRPGSLKTPLHVVTTKPLFGENLLSEWRQDMDME